MDELIAKAHAPRSFTGHWKIQQEAFHQDFLGELVYDPIKGYHKLTLYGVCIIPETNTPRFAAITGIVTTGEKVSVYDSIVVGANSGKNETLSQKTVFSFLFFCIGDESFTSKEAIRLKKYSFRCSNLEAWFQYRPFRHRFSLKSKRKRNLGTLDIPRPLLLFEDDVVRIKLATTINQNMTPTSLNVSYLHELSISAKNNRKLPYIGEEKSFSYYEKVIHDFFCLVIGKHAFSFNCIGATKKKRIILPENIQPSALTKNLHSFQHISFYNACQRDERWLESISSQQMLAGHSVLKGDVLTFAIKKFFEKYPKFSFVLDDWIRMKNQSSYTNYSLPELLYNFEGLHRSLYPECSTSSGYKAAINAIHAVSPFKEYEHMINNKNHELSFRQRLQDAFLVKTSLIFQFLSIPQRQSIIDDLVEIRNNAAHRGQSSLQTYSKVITYIFLCEELIAVMILHCIGLQMEQIREMLVNGWEWLDLKTLLLKELPGAESC